MSAKPIAVLVLPGPDGPLTVAATERGVVAAEWWGDESAMERDLGRRLGSIESVREGPAADFLRRWRPAIDAILTRRSQDLASVPLDLADRPTFDQAVLGAVRSLGWGETASYGEIARRVGAPRAARAVGGAVGRCPIALLIPCHRVIAADGTLGGYGGDEPGGRGDALDRKQQLLAREGVTVPRRAV
ncbi:MAG: methylated-DNA--[protein]-cysteine S-methyltransferase [Candidatus Limnocylindrales bacterium]